MQFLMQGLQVRLFCPYLALLTPSTPGAFVPSSASKHARRLSTVKWCINDVCRVCGSLRARLAIRATPVCAALPPLRVGGVAVERAAAWVPLCSMGVTPLPRSYGDIRLPMGRWASFRCAGCATLPPAVEEPMGPPEFPSLPC
jgi:hypothetical protein